MSGHTEEQKKCFTRSLNCSLKDLRFISSSDVVFKKKFENLKRLATVTLKTGDIVDFMLNSKQKRFLFLKKNKQNYLIYSSNE